LCHARFTRPLRGILLDQLRQNFPGLCRKVDRLTVDQFETVCGLIKQQVGRWA
jgi:hypothetical protein